MTSSINPNSLASIGLIYLSLSNKFSAKKKYTKQLHTNNATPVY